MNLSLVDVERRLERGSERKALLAELSEGSEAERWLARALRRDLAFLALHPELTFPCVYRLGWWHDTEAATAFLTGNAPEPQRSPLRPLLEAWRQQWESQRRGPWLRALRPPAIPLDAPLLEEYCGVDEHLPVSFSRTDEYVGTCGPGSLAWDRQTGRKMPSDRARWLMPSTERTRYTFAQKPPDGYAWLLDNQTGNKVSIPRQGMSFTHTSVELESGRVLLTSWDDEAYSLVYLLDFDTPRELWRMDFFGEVKGLAGSLNRRHALMWDSWGDSYFFETLEPASRKGPLQIGGGNSALSSEGKLAANVVGGVLRVWDLQKLLERSWPRPLCPSHWPSARFSPDGELLLTKNLLCDARTGRVIKTFEVSTKRVVHLAGGPLMGGQALVRGGFIEMSEEGGVRRLDARGQLTLQDGSRQYGNNQQLAISPDGTRYAVGGYFPRDAPVLVLRVEDGREVARLSHRDMNRMTWSPDGGFLASVTDEYEVTLLSEDGTERTLGTHRFARDLRFSHDGRLLASFDFSDVKVWDTREGRLRAESPLSDLEMDDADEPLPFGWAGFHEQGYPYEGRYKAGIFEVTQGRLGTAVVRIPSGEPLSPDPTGTYWAGGTSHYVLEES